MTRESADCTYVYNYINSTTGCWILKTEFDSKEEAWRTKKRPSVDSLQNGRDEMNLAEFPLAAISDRFLDGTKTVVFSDSVWDSELRQHVPRELTVSGSDLYGLPTAKDDDVLLACIQVSSLGDFHSREVHFSRYELLKLLRWPDEGKYYHRLATSLRRWKGLTIFSNRAFYDNGRKSWVNRDFGVFDKLQIYEREIHERMSAPPSSSFIWNEVLFDSFQAGYLKQLDWDLYCELKNPVAKRLYRFLDKRFYYGDRLTIDLHELAFKKVRLSQNYNTAQVKRALVGGIRELEALWDLKPLSDQKRFRKISRGKWEAVFVRRRKPTKRQQEQEIKSLDLVYELTKRDIGPACADELVAKYPQDRIQTMIELYDWYNGRGQEKGPGFIVAGIKSPAAYRLPKGFETSDQKTKRKQASHLRKRAEQELQKKKEAKTSANEKAKYAPFWTYWNGLTEGEQAAFEAEAVGTAEPLKRRWYEESRASGRQSHDAFRTVILRDHFLKSHSPGGVHRDTSRRRSS